MKVKMKLTTIKMTLIMTKINMTKMTKMRKIVTIIVAVMAEK